MELNILENGKFWILYLTGLLPNVRFSIISSQSHTSLSYREACIKELGRRGLFAFLLSHDWSLIAQSYYVFYKYDKVQDFCKW